MKKLTILVLVFSLLFIGCSGTIDKGSDKRLRVGKNRGIEFQNILSGNNKTIYGFSEIRFGSRYDSAFAIISVPANEEISTYINAIITPEQRSPKLSLMTYKEPPTFSLYLNGSNENLQISTNGSADETHEIGIIGTFLPYMQENLVFMSSSDLINPKEDSDGKGRQFSGENSVYIIPYPWRKINVKIEGDTSDYNNTIQWANNNVFRQAVCSLQVTTDSVNYDCKIKFVSNISKNVVFLDESEKEYDMFNSGKIVSAQVKTGSNKNKSFSYAVAYLLGVSEDNSQPNLMTSGDNNEEHIHLTFRQWNQLHATESGK